MFEASEDMCLLSVSMSTHDPHPPVSPGPVRAGAVSAGVAKYTQGNRFILILILALASLIVLWLSFGSNIEMAALVIFGSVLVLISLAMWAQGRSPIRTRRDGWGVDELSGVDGATTDWKDQLAYFLFFLSPMSATFLRDMVGSLPAAVIAIAMLALGGWYSFLRENSEFVLNPRAITATDRDDTSSRGLILAALEACRVVEDSALNPAETPAYPEAPGYSCGAAVLFTDVLPKLTRLPEHEVATELERLQRQHIVRLRKFTEGATARSRVRDVVEGYL